MTQRGGPRSAAQSIDYTHLLVLGPVQQRSGRLPPRPPAWAAAGLGVASVSTFGSKDAVEVRLVRVRDSSDGTASLTLTLNTKARSLTVTYVGDEVMLADSVKIKVDAHAVVETYTDATRLYLDLCAPPRT